MCRKLRELYSSLNDKWKGKAESSLNFRIEWFNCVRELSNKYCMDKEDMNLRIVISTVSKYGLKYLQNEPCRSNSLQRNDTEQEEVLVPQLEAGIKVLSGGVLGKMFKLYKRKRGKYQAEIKVLACMIVVEKAKVFVPVEQRCCDNGGLYMIRNEYLPIIKTLDEAIREEFVKIKHHGPNIVKVRLRCIKDLLNFKFHIILFCKNFFVSYFCFRS